MTCNILRSNVPLSGSADNDPSPASNGVCALPSFTAAELHYTGFRALTVFTLLTGEPILTELRLVISRQAADLYRLINPELRYTMRPTAEHALLTLACRCSPACGR